MENSLEFSRFEIATVQANVDARWGRSKVELLLADVGLRSKDRNEIMEYPALFWSVNECNFVIQKLARQRYRCQFFYSDLEQYGTDIDVFDDLDICTRRLLQLQADFQSQREGNFPGSGAPDGHTQ